MSKADPNQNREDGKGFESLFFSRAQINGFLVIQNHYTCRFTPGGRVQVIKGELDFKIISQTGRVGYFDCKTYAKDQFSFSALEPKQVDRAATYNYWKVPSGFVVWFRKANHVQFYSGEEIQEKGPRSSFTCSEGLSLGGYENFDLKPLLEYQERGGRLIR